MSCRDSLLERFLIPFCEFEYFDVYNASVYSVTTMTLSAKDLSKRTSNLLLVS